MHRIHILVLLVLLLLPGQTYAQQAANEFRRIDITDGLSNNQVNTIFSDSRGFMWFATISGLNRFDGNHFRIYRNDPSNPGLLPENSIHHIFEDHLGYLWFFNTTGGYSIYEPETEVFSQYHPLFLKEPELANAGINVLKTDPKGNLWLATSQSGIFCYLTDSDSIIQIKSDASDPGSLSEGSVLDLAFDSQSQVYAITQAGIINVIDDGAHTVSEKFSYEKGALYNPSGRQYRLIIDGDDDIWLFSVNSGDGVYMIDSESRQTQNFTHLTRPLTLSHSNIAGVLADDSGKIWIGTEHGGVNVINKNDFSVKILSHIPGDITSLSANSITSLCLGSDGIIWVGTFKNGVNYYHDQLFLFSLYRSQPMQEEQYFHNDVNCFAEDSKGNLWMGTNGEGLVYYNRSTGTFTRYRTIPGNPNSLSSNVIVSLHVDADDKLWVGTYLGGLNHFDGQRFTRFRHNPDEPGSLADDRIWDIHRDAAGNLWIATLGGGLDLFNEKTGSFMHHQTGDYNSISSDFVLTLLEDSTGNLWIGTNLGLNMLDKATGRFHQFVHDPQDPQSISNNYVISLQEDAPGILWVGTRNGLNLFTRDSGSFRVFRQADGLPDHHIISLEKDDDQTLWMATLNGISALSHDGNYQDFVFHNYDVNDGLQGREFNEHSSLKTSAGEIIFGGANGFNLFKPEDITPEQKQYPVIFTEFRLFNENVKVGQQFNGNNLLPKTLDFTQEIRLRHYQNVFSIGFSALNFFQSDRTRFRYMLEGFHNQWIETNGENALATFTNLNPGKYRFKVAARAGNGDWGPEKVLSVVVVPPYYATYWAYGFYIIMFVILIFRLVAVIKNREVARYARQQQKDEYDRMRDLDAMKTRFFTNVSHEFRTPLTMILTPVERLLKETPDEKMHGQLTIINRNARRLLSLVNQLLDFRKLEVNRIHINMKYGDIVVLLRESFESFSDLFESKNIQNQFTTNISEYFVHFDADKIEKVAFNLLSNAIKFTPENGSIEMKLCHKVPGSANFEDIFDGREYFEIQVADTGIGISPEKQKLVFDRFFHSDDHTSVINQGSGIGLSLTLEFVKLHNGQIKLDSEPGKGSTFTVQIPLATYLTNEQETLPTEIEKEETSAAPFSKAVSIDLPLKAHGALPILLIAEDNEDMRFYLKENLKNDYSVLEASTGNQAWDIIQQQQTPDLVVSDIMMPGMSGLDLCRKIKSDNRTSHIPVILLTARTAAEQKLEGLKAGAEDYITKPFSYEMLHLKIKSLIDLRQSFIKNFHQKFEIKPGEIGITSLDEKFLAKALKVAEENIGNSEFSVEKMGRELGVSRGHLYNKLVALTGKTPVEFIRIMRLKRASQLLGKSQLTVSEIAFQVGFNDPKYFSKYFKEEFGMVPSEFAKRNG